MFVLYIVLALTALSCAVNAYGDYQFNKFDRNNP